MSNTIPFSTVLHGKEHKACKMQYAFEILLRKKKICHIEKLIKS